MPNASRHLSRTVTAPEPSFASATLSPNRVLCVDLEADEDVEWITTANADGTTYVSGYTIVKREDPGETSKSAEK